jgi:antitoxin FitA
MAKPLLDTDVSTEISGSNKEAEASTLVDRVTRPESRIKLGSLLAEIGQQVGGFDLELELALESDISPRDQ